MARSQSTAGISRPATHPTLTGRPSLIPQDPLSGWQALIQALLLLGVPILLLLLAKVVLRNFFPELGY